MRLQGFTSYTNLRTGTVNQVQQLHKGKYGCTSNSVCTAMLFYTESIDGVCFTIKMKPSVTTATGDYLTGPDLQTQRDKKRGQRLKCYRSMQSPPSKNDYTALQRAGIKSTHVTLKLSKPQRPGVVTQHFVLLLNISVLLSFSF